MEIDENGRTFNNAATTHPAAVKRRRIFNLPSKQTFSKPHATKSRVRENAALFKVG
jgi:hypothetical protein